MTDTNIPVPKNLRQMMEVLEKEFTTYKTLEGNVARLSAIIDGYRPNAQDWKEYALFDPSRYTRNLVDDGNGKFSLIIQSWGPSQATSIFDMENSHCIFKCLHGELTESLYEIPKTEGPMHLIKETLHGTGQVSYMSHKKGLQQLMNKSHGPSVSLHLYCPPLNESLTYSPASSRCRGREKYTLHSKYGELTHPAIRRFSLGQNCTVASDYYKTSVVPPVVGVKVVPKIIE
jgi:cysteine dioxygenase